jgi:methylenetetrahydrofolate--tRNA-(uracil-5-)-methyltransferase
MDRQVTIVGGGLAGAEAAWQLARRGVSVRLLEMRPGRSTPAHRTDLLAELVCSNSLRGDALDQPAGLLKEEMRRLDSLIVRVADQVRVPAGSALAVDRVRFAEEVTAALRARPEVEIERREAKRIPGGAVVVLATGPLTTDTLARDIAAFVGESHLHFFDAISPVVETESIDAGKIFRASRYGRGGDDYLNCPMSEEEYRGFLAALLAAEPAALHDFDRQLFFEGCLPIEVLARRGPEALLFGPLKPVGLVDPRTGRRPFAVAQLRQDDLAATHHSMVGFQTQIKWGQQAKVFRMIPGLERAEFIRFGMVHRNTYVNAPRVLRVTFETRRRPGLFLAGQMSGVEGYVESAASGLVAGLGAAARLRGQSPPRFPEETALGALGRHVSGGNARSYQPTNIQFGLLPDLGHRVRDKRARRQALSRRALESLDRFRSQVLGEVGLEAGRAGG